jgi:glycosyltransferase involved in cell wall biosynthesis
MKILHLSTFDADSGAARGSLWLHHALRRRGVDSTMLVGRQHRPDSTIRPLPGKVAQLAARLRMRFDALPLRRYDKTDDSFWTIGWMPSRIGRMVADFAPDIVHLHWVGAGFLPIRAMAQFPCPVVWTLRDMWPMTGGCHYTAGCERYRQACGTCPQLRSEDEEDLSRTVWRSKRRHWRNLDLHLVPISRWLGDCVRASPLLRDYPLDVIPNGLDIGLFTPVGKAAGRAAWQLPADRPVIVYGAVNATTDPRKGFAELQAALKILGRDQGDRRPLLVVFGDLQPGDIPDCGVEIRYVGYIRDNTRLSQLYAAGDVAVMPSLQEAFGKTLIEAMACATPVVAFGGGGPDDIIDHRADGYLARPFEPADLAAGIAWSLATVAAGADLGQRARAKVAAAFDIDVVAARYQALYRRILLARAAGNESSMAAQ